MSKPAPVGYVDPNFPDPNGPQDAPIIIYGYTPSLVLALLGVILFSISTILHFFQLLRYRSWFFAPLLVGTTMEIVGYTFRILSSQRDPYNIIYFVVQYFFIVVAPVFFSAAIYIVLTKLIRVTNQHSAMPPRLILWLFIVCDVVSTGVQIAGAASIGRQESARKDPTTANNILLAGLAFQVFSFLAFLSFLTLFAHRARKAIMTKVSLKFFIAFMAASLLVYLRTCFRLAETSRGVHGTLSSHEIYFGCLEFAPVVVAVFLFNTWHPGKWLSRLDWD